MKNPSIGLAIIAKNESENLPRLLESIEGAFDRVVLLDTGSTDDTVYVFQEWAGNQPITFSVAEFDWCDDFAAAREAADNLLVNGGCTSPIPPDGQAMVDWKCWADCDDVIVNAGELRQLAATAPPQVAALTFDYNYAQHPTTGQPICVLKRERLVRVGAGKWLGRVHEAQVISGPVTMVPAGVAHWRHTKQEQGGDALAASNTRNLGILHAWLDDEPENPRVLAYLGNEHAVRGESAEAIGYFERYRALITGWDEERAQVYRKLASLYLADGRVDDAEALALLAIGLVPTWPDSYLTLAEVALHRNDSEKAIHFAQQALGWGIPDTLLIINPLDYACHPHRLLAGALGTLGRWDQAIEHVEQALAHEPGDPTLRQGWMHFKAEAKREHTAQTYVMAAQQLIGHDEQSKALTLLEDCVPVFATDHPAVVALRSQVRERLHWTRTAGAFADHYETGGSKPEDFIPDDQITDLCSRLPRVAFLVDGLREQAAA